GAQTGFTNHLGGADARTAYIAETNAEQTSGNLGWTFTDPMTVTTYVEADAVPWTNGSARYLLRRIYNADNPPVGLSGSAATPANAPSLQYDYDSLWRVKQAWDADALLMPGTRNPYQFYVANHIRGERQDPTGASYAVEYDVNGRPLEYFDELGR